MNVEPKFTTKQKQALKYLVDNKTNEVLFGGAAGGGKSWIGVSWLIVQCFKYPKVRYLMGRSKLDALKKTTLNTFFEVCNEWGLKSDTHYKFNASSNVITFYNGSEILLKDLFLYPSDRNFDSLGSLEITGAFIDEANQITEKAKNIVMSRIRYKLDEYQLVPKLLMTCNPAKNWVYTDYYKKSKDGTLEGYKKFIQSLVNDNDYISKHYAEQLSKLDEVSKQRLLFGNWEYDINSDNLIDYDSILLMFDNTGIEGDKYITCDVARLGNDKSVVMLWNGLQVELIKTFDKNTITELANYIKDLQVKHRVNLKNIIADSDGVGGGLADILRCVNFINNARPFNNENYQNLKTQCYYKLSDLINKAQIGVSATMQEKNKLIEELEQVRAKDIDKDTKLKLIPKDIVKTIIGRSPDYSDCLMMRMYFEFNKRGFYSIR
jgi:phage terminase large subunit